MDEAVPERPGLTRMRWEIRLRDGGPPIRGDLRSPRGSAPRSAVVVCHGFKGFREWGFFPPLARALAARGHAAVTFDFSRNGVGADGVDFSALDRFAENTHSRNVDEIHAVLDALQNRRLLPNSPERIGLFGHSRGGGEAILAAAEDARVDALVTWAAIASVDRWSASEILQWQQGKTVDISNARTGQQMPIGPGFWSDIVRNEERLDIARAARALRVPWLIVHGEGDTSVSVEDARVLSRAAGPNAELLLVEEAGHTFGATHPFAGATPELRTAMGATLDWFDAHLAR